MKNLCAFLLWCGAGAAWTAAASAQSPVQEICDRLWDRTQGAGTRDKAPYAAFLARCGGDRRAASARAKIAQIDRQIRTEREARERVEAARVQRLRDQRLREQRAREERAQARQDELDRHSRELQRQREAQRQQELERQRELDRQAQAQRAATARAITIENKCTDTIKVRLVFRTETGWSRSVQSGAGLNAPGLEWTLGPGQSITPASGDSPVTTTSPDIYYQVRRDVPGGVWSEGPTKFDYGIGDLPFILITASLTEYGKYYFYFC